MADLGLAQAQQFKSRFSDEKAPQGRETSQGLYVDMARFNDLHAQVQQLKRQLKSGKPSSMSTMHQMENMDV